MTRALFVAVAVVAACTPKASEDVKPDVTLASVAASAASSSAPAERGKVVVQAAAADGDAISIIRTARLQAKAQGRVLVVYVSATWCEPCKRLKAEIEAGSLDDRLGKTTLLAFDADKDVERLGAAGYSFKFVPYVALPGPDGQPADSQQATGKGSNAWKELLGKLDAWQAQAPK
ncbi:MAG: thioredoxin family protein [Labilithrix sp.]|nr:thioredoxin family protein [Labilithrix sp.]MCW5814650.1 thioredoxin family protein [Labilithrix sp.]